MSVTRRDQSPPSGKDEKLSDVEQVGTGLQQTSSVAEGEINADDRNGQFHRSISPRQIHVCLAELAIFLPLDGHNDIL